MNNGPTYSDSLKYPGSGSANFATTTATKHQPQRFQIVAKDIEATILDARQVLDLAQAVAERICGGNVSQGSGNPVAVDQPASGLLETYTFGVRDIGNVLGSIRYQLQRIADDIG